MNNARTVRLSLMFALLAATPAAAEPLGRLFFTPAQRAALDTARQQNVRIEVEPEEDATAPTTTPETITLNGVIRRSDGQSTVWVNNKPVDVKKSDGLRIVGDNERHVTIQLPNSDNRVQLKVGQQFDAASGQVVESYNSRATLPEKPASDQPPVKKSETAKRAPLPLNEPVPAAGNED